VADWEAREIVHAAALSSAWGPLAERTTVQSTLPWLAAAEEAALPADSRALYLECVAAENRVALFPLKVTGRHLSSFTTPYSTLYQPLVAASLDRAALERAGKVLGVVGRRFSTLRLEALDPAWPEWEPLLLGVAQAGLVRQNFTHFGNWHQTVGDWPSYLASRPGALRETIRRKTAAALRQSSVRLELVNEPSALPAALAAYEAIYARSWKEPEPFQGFNAALLPRLATLGAVRLGLMWDGDRPIAAQYWTVWRGTATILKLAHDETLRSQSPGTVLTAWMIRHLIERDGVTELDFGRGDDEYKQLWVSSRRQRTGVIFANPRRWGGILEIARHRAGRLRDIVGLRV